MRVLTENVANSKGGRAIAIFGLGLIGSAIRDALQLRIPFQEREMSFSWSDPASQKSELGRIRTFLQSSSAESIDIVWSAGRGGFYTDSDQLRAEFLSFTNVLVLARALARAEPLAVSVHLVSSAGGLFEGQQLVQKKSEPAPLRPYGDLKLKQELELLKSDPPLRKNIFRPSSVYGYIGGGRMGLLPTILKFGIMHKELRVVGNQNTLRDFVYVKDVGDHIARRITVPSREHVNVEFLVSGRPCSIFAIQHVAENLVRRKVYFVFAPQHTNSLDITYSRDTMPEKWEPVDIETGMRRLLNDIRQRK